jgi:hypothetical protein
LRQRLQLGNWQAAGPAIGQGQQGWPRPALSTSASIGTATSIRSTATRTSTSAATGRQAGQQFARAGHCALLPGCRQALQPGGRHPPFTGQQKRGIAAATAAQQGRQQQAAGAAQAQLQQATPPQQGGTRGRAREIERHRRDPRHPRARGCSAAAHNRHRRAPPTRRRAGH